MRLVQFLALAFTAIALAPGGAHLFALPNKIAMTKADYLVAQHVYNGWAWLGVALIGALLANAGAAFVVRGKGAPFILACTSTLGIAAMLAIFFTFTFPANRATANWTMLPDNWEVLRRQWEYSHAINAFITFAAFCALSWSILLSRK
jgi:hypothetical protein